MGRRLSCSGKNNNDNNTDNKDNNTDNKDNNTERSIMKTAWWAIVLVVICTFFVSSAQVFYKFASAKLPEIMTNWQLFSGIALYAIGALLLIVAFKYGEVSVLNPVFATSYIWVILFSNFFFNEPVTLTKVLGAAVIIAGITFVSIGSRKGSALEYAGEL